MDNIKNWIMKTAEELGEIVDDESYKTKDGRSISFHDEAYEELRKKATDGQLSDEVATAVSEIEFLLDTAKVATARILDKMETKEGATKGIPASPAAVEKDLKAVPPPLPSGKDPTKIPGKIKEPETTKWKEIRFNKRTGTWQVVITTRHTRNFATEDEAIDFTRKASLKKEAGKGKVEQVPPSDEESDK